MTVANISKFVLLPLPYWIGSATSKGRVSLPCTILFLTSAPAFVGLHVMLRGAGVRHRHRRQVRHYVMSVRTKSSSSGR